MRYALFLWVAVLVALVPLLGCADARTAPGVTEDEVVFGITGPLSGPAAAWGGIAQGAQAWADHVNAEGGVNGRQIRVLMKDDGYTPGRAVANVSEMEEDVLALVTMVGTAVCNAAKDQIAESGVPLVMPFCNVRVWEEQPREKIQRVFVGYQDYRAEGEFLARHAGGQGVKTVAAFYQNDDYGRDELEGLKAGVAEAGVEILAEVPYELQDRELGLHALQVRDSGAEAVMLFSTPTHAANLVNEMAKLEYRPLIFAPTPLGDPEIMFRLLGDHWVGAHYSAYFPPEGNPEYDRMEEILLAQDPSLADRMMLALVGAGAMKTAEEALRAAGPLPTRESFVEALESTTVEGFFVAPIAFGPDRRHGFNAVALHRAGQGPDDPAEVVAEAEEFPPLF